MEMCGRGLKATIPNARTWYVTGAQSVAAAVANDWTKEVGDMDTVRR